jgi:hypothetical protein
MCFDSAFILSLSPSIFLSLLTWIPGPVSISPLTASGTSHHSPALLLPPLGLLIVGLPAKSVRVLCRIYEAELSGLKLVLVSREYTLVECLNQLLKMIGELDSKDHQLALMNRQVQLQDRWIAELEAQLVDVHKGRM